MLGADAEGLLEVKAAQLGAGSGWIRTTDLARIDADGFVWILGRADQAIIRGGFKVRPDDVRAALERHPRVRGAAVVGRPDARLGAVPVAAVELRRGRGADHGRRTCSRTPRRRLARYELPAEIRIVDELPRTDVGARSTSPRVERAASRRGPVDDMDLRYSREDEAFRAEIRAWLEKEVPAHGPPPPPGDWPARRAYDTAWQRKLYDAGYAGLAWPAEFGGRGLPISQQLVYLEEYARADAPYISVNFVGLMHAGPTLIAEGSDEQRRSTCRASSAATASGVRASPSRRPAPTSPRCARGRCATATSTSVSGQKIWSTRAHVADYCELLVRTDPDAPKHKGITWLILDMHQPGVEVRPMRTLDGESHFCEVFLDEARVPVAEPGRRRERRLARRQRDAALRARHRVRAAHHHDARAGPCGSCRSRGRAARRGTAGTTLRAQGRAARGERRGALADDADVHRRGRAHRARRRRSAPRSSSATASSARRSPSSRCALDRPADHRPAESDGVATARGRARVPVVAAVHDRRGHLADPAQPDRRAHPRPAEGALMTRWTLRRRAAAADARASRR